jgi:hypothetical protein
MKSNVKLTNTELQALSTQEREALAANGMAIKRSCGCIESARNLGRGKSRLMRIEYFTNTPCARCRKQSHQHQHQHQQN